MFCLRMSLPVRNLSNRCRMPGLFLQGTKLLCSIFSVWIGFRYYFVLKLSFHYLSNKMDFLLLLQCAAGEAIETPCTPGLSYDPENHVCNYPDLVPGDILREHIFINLTFSLPLLKAVSNQFSSSIDLFFTTECASQAEAVVGFKCPSPAELPPVARR